MWTMTPVVYAVGREYQIMLPTTCQCTMKVEIGDAVFGDASNGILRSDVLVHRVTVPMELLDRAKRYRVYLQPVLDRVPKYAVLGECECRDFEFQPVAGETVRAYHVADNHGLKREPVEAAFAYGHIDFLILNGDLANRFNDKSAVLDVYELASRMTQGRIPVVLARGNHDTRGKYGEQFTEHFPCRNQTTYYTFRLGSIWGMVLDCGEDKDDSHPEYCGLVCCHDFRQQETAYIRQVIRQAEAEYAAPGVTHRIIISHVPFTALDEGEFDIERDIYAQWVRLLRENIKPDIMLSGHLHIWDIYDCGSEKDAFGQACPTVVGSELVRGKEEAYLAGAGLEFSPKGIGVTFTDCRGTVKRMKQI